MKLSIRSPSCSLVLTARFGFVAFALALTACGGAGDATGDPGASDAGSDGDVGLPPDIETPGMRPELTSPGQIVPLLYGRSVAIEDRRGGAWVLVRVPLDDPRDQSHGDIFGHIDLACRAEVASAFSIADVRGTSDAMCGESAAVEAQVSLCRARTARAFSAPAPVGTLWLEGGEPRVDLSTSEHQGGVFAVTSPAIFDRASWAMYAVAATREVIGRAGLALDPARCPRSTSDGNAAWPVWAASALRDATSELLEVTSLADGLLADRLHEKYDGAPDSPTIRAQGTRELWDSLLERLKLQVGVPYASFIPAGGEASDAVEHADRYPVLYAPASASIEQSALMLSVLGTPLLGSEQEMLTGDALRDAWFASLKDQQPLVFGGLGADQADDALAQFGSAQGELEGAALYLRQLLRVSGLPDVSRLLHDGEHRFVETLRNLHERGPLGYVAALTEARATLATSDGPAYAARGLSTSLEYARRTARASLESGLPIEADDALRAVANDDRFPAVRAELCMNTERATEPATLEIRLLELPADQSADELGARYELFAGERDVACAIGPVYGSPCRPQADSLMGVFDPETRSLQFQVTGDDTSSATYYLTERGASPTTIHGRAIVAVFSRNALEPGEGTRCGIVPLDGELHLELAKLHEAEVAASLPRVVKPPSGTLHYALSPRSPVPLLWEQKVRFSDGDKTLEVDLAQPFDSLRRDVERSVLAGCLEPTLNGRGSANKMCVPIPALEQRLCLLNALRALPDTKRLGDYTVPLASLNEQFAVALWTHEAARDLVAELGDALKDFACEDGAVEAAAGTPSYEAVLWNLAAVESDSLVSSFLALFREYESRIASDLESVHGVLAVRGLHDSRLAAARLLLAIPHQLYEPNAGSGNGVGGLYEQFPAVTERAEVAEDTLAEDLIRIGGLDPRLPELSFEHGAFSASRYGEALLSDAFVDRLRTRLVAADPARYAGTPSSADSFLGKLGLSRTQLRSAALRLVQLSEARGQSLLPRPNTTPAQTSGLGGKYPAPNGMQLYALSEGRLETAIDAWPTHFAARGLFHTLAALSRTMTARTASSSEWSNAERTERLAIAKRIATYAARPEATLEFSGADSPAVELYLAAAPSEELTATHELWWTDAGLACALHGRVAGEVCDEADFRFGDVQVATALTQSESDAGLVARLSGFSFPAPRSWDPLRSQELGRGRVYLTRMHGESRELLASASLQRDRMQEQRVELPSSVLFTSYVSELLGYREPGQGCADCRPNSVCERTECERGLCLRTPSNGTPCAAQGQCMAGICDEPGCGDGARSDGLDEVPFEACDDGNLEDGDGCSATCAVEARTLEPLIRQGWPSGPAPALATDGLGQALLVYMADDLSGETVRIRGARFDAFGVRVGSEFDLETGLARGFQSQPTVAGLRNGGFVVIYASPALEPNGGIAFRLIDAEGEASELFAVDDNGAAQSDARVVSVEDGFAIAWAERTGFNGGSRVRMRGFDGSGDPAGAPIDAAIPDPDVSQSKPVLASSLGQVAVAWSEAKDHGAQLLGVRARRFGPTLAPIDRAALMVSSGLDREPTIAVLSSGDYRIVWTSSDSDSNGDLNARTLSRFGTAFDGGEESLVATSAAETKPVFAAGVGDSYVVAYQLGTPFSVGTLQARGVDAESLNVAHSELSQSDLQDVSLVRAPQGIWMLWSRRVDVRRVLFALLLPPSD